VAEKIDRRFVAALRGAAAQMAELASMDRDARHVETELVRTMRSWVRLRLPGHRCLVHCIERIEELEEDADG
jgi:hypothetical protein